jgi:hypothetical protein
VSVDGTYNNTNLTNDGFLETSLNMGYYDFTNAIPVNIKFKGFEKKIEKLNHLLMTLKKKIFLQIMSFLFLIGHMTLMIYLIIWIEIIINMYVELRNLVYI